MKFSFFSDIIRSVWEVDVPTVMAYLPILQGLRQGHAIDFDFEKTTPFSLLPILSEYAYDGDDVTGFSSSEEEKQYISLLHVHGVMLRDDAPCGPVGTKTLARLLQAADSNKNVISHIIVIDSGGGQASSVKPLADAIRACKKDVVAYIDETAASAAYGIASQCAEIVAAHERCVVGSIGTMVSFSGIPANTTIDGMNHIRVYATRSTQKNMEFEAAINEMNFKPLIENILDPINEDFINLISTARPQLTEEHLSGATFFASESEGKLVDRIETFENFVNEIKRNHMKTKTLSQFMAELERDADGNIFLNHEQIEEMNSILNSTPAAAVAPAATGKKPENDRIAKIETDMQITVKAIQALGEGVKLLSRQMTHLLTADGDESTKVKSPIDPKRTNSTADFRIDMELEDAFATLLEEGWNPKF